MFTIYKATNKITKKSYIGFDCKWPYRKSAHKHAVKGGSNLVFHNAIRSYGWENFEWEIVEQHEDKYYLLNEREEYFIRKFNTHYLNENGYNMTYGGEATFGWVPSDETKERISNAKKGKSLNLTVDDRQRRKQLLTDNNPMNDPIIREKHRQRLLETKTSARHVTDGKIIYDSIRDANKHHNSIKYSTLHYWITKNKNGWSYV